MGSHPDHATQRGELTVSRRSGSSMMAIAAVAAVISIFGLIFSLLLLGGAESDAATCDPPDGLSVSIDPDSVPDIPVEGYGHEQLINAAHVIHAGETLGLGVRDQTIGVMTAMGESGLRVLDHGDAAGPDSRGLFQQRDNGAWGTYEDRMDPHRSSVMFFEVLQGLTDRSNLEPTIAAHRVQRNADPFHYAPFWGPAVAVVEALSGIDTGMVPGAGGDVCTTQPPIPGEVSPEGWAQPASGPITSRFGLRRDPVTGGFTILHAGTDFGGGGDGGAIWSAQDGVVIDVYTDAHGGWTIDVDHGGAVMTRYKHMWPNGILVSPGDHVTAGQQIGRVGSSGWSTGPHLHFEVHVNGSPTDPEVFFADLGISLR